MSNDLTKTSYAVNFEAGDLLYGELRADDSSITVNWLHGGSWSPMSLDDATLADLRSKLIKALAKVEDAMEDRNLLGRVTKRAQ